MQIKKFQKAKYLLFIFLFLSLHLSASNIECEWSGVEKIVAVGDIHGDFRNFVKILKGTGIIDNQLHWSGGKTHLVQTGDIMDRGPNARKVFDLLKKLEKEAEEAGGKVHMLIGNHEEMNITGIAFGQPEYVTVDQFLSFLPEKYIAHKKKEFLAKLSSSNTDSGPEDTVSLSDSMIKNYWRNLIRTDPQARKLYTDFFNENYGKWILQHNAVIKINDIVFVHGGISEKFSTWKLKDINDLLRKELTFLQTALRRSQQTQILQLQIVYKEDGPLWFRGLALKNEELFREDVDRILRNLNANHIVIAHTTRQGVKATKDNLSRFKGKIWIIDTGISEFYGGNLSALIIENGKFTVWGEK